MLFHLRDAFRAGDVWLARSRRYGYIREALLSAPAPDADRSLPARAVQEVGSEVVLREALLDGTVSVGDAYTVRDSEPAGLDEAVAGVRNGDAGSLSEAVAGASEGGPSSDALGVGADEREPRLARAASGRRFLGGTSSDAPVRGNGGDAGGAGRRRRVRVAPARTTRSLG